VDDPRGPVGVTPARRVIRGGSGVIVSVGWISTPVNARSASRIKCRPEAQANYLGFRVARVQSAG
jgi:hypothetical protein